MRVDKSNMGVVKSDGLTGGKIIYQKYQNILVKL